MTTQEINQIRQCIQQIRKLNIPDKLAQQFPNTDLTQHQFTNLNAAQIIALTERLITQFSDELDTPDAAFLSKGYYWETPQHAMTHRHIFTVMKQLTTHLTNNQWDAASQHLELAIGYQMQNGFWNRSGRKLQSVTKLKQAELFSDLDTKAAQIRELLTLVTNLKEDHAQEVNKRKSDANAIATELAQAQKGAGEINSLLSKSNGENGQIAQMLATQRSNLEKTNTELKEIAEGKASLQIALTTAADKLSISEDRLKFMQDKSEWVNALAGTAAAGVLGKKFEARMRQLNKSSEIWAKATAWSVVAAAIWLFFAHKYLIVHGEGVWGTFALNFGLLLPAVFIVGFFAKQYGKVRHFEEEYAFRSAVAMTVSAFADRLDPSKPGERDKLITETVEKLYRLPVLLQERESHGWFSQRSTERMVKATTELVATVKRPTA